jgi:hypothetical protein
LAERSQFVVDTLNNIPGYKVDWIAWFIKTNFAKAALYITLDLLYQFDIKSNLVFVTFQEHDYCMHALSVILNSNLLFRKHIIVER